MKLSFRALIHRLLTYPVLLPIGLIYGKAVNKNPILDAFYLIRGFPHGYLKDGLRVALYNSLEIVFPFTEDPSFDDVWLRQVYFPYKPRSEHTVIDVGAHMGFFTLRVANSVRKVVAVEPDPTSFRFLAFNVQRNDLQNKVILLKLALGEKNDGIYLDRTGYGFGRSKISLKKKGSRVPMKTLDSVVERAELEHVDLIKIDTEGSEPQILKGAIRTIREYEPDLLIAAYHSPNEFRELQVFLRSHGYHVFRYYVPFFLARGGEFYLYARARMHHNERVPANYESPLHN